MFIHVYLLWKQEFSWYKNDTYTNFDLWEVKTKKTDQLYYLNFQAKFCTLFFCTIWAMRRFVMAFADVQPFEFRGDHVKFLWLGSLWYVVSTVTRWGDTAIRSSSVLHGNTFEEGKEVCAFLKQVYTWSKRSENDLATQHILLNTGHFIPLFIVAGSSLSTRIFHNYVWQLPTFQLHNCMSIYISVCNLCTCN